MRVCGHGGYCMRVPGHMGVHTARPTPLANGWDANREEIAQRHIDAATCLDALDYPMPWWAEVLFDGMEEE